MRIMADSSLSADKKIDHAILVLSEGRDELFALQGLAKMTVVEQRREEVSKAIELVMDNPSDSYQDEAVAALTKWATQHNVNSLCKYLRSVPSYRAKNVLEALMAAGPNKLTVLTIFNFQVKLSNQRYVSSSDKALIQDSVFVLRTMRGLVEDVMLPFLEHPEEDVQFGTLQLLSEFGSQKSLETLKKMVSKFSSVAMRKEARRAIQRMEFRINKIENNPVFQP